MARETCANVPDPAPRSQPSTGWHTPPGRPPGAQAEQTRSDAELYTEITVQPDRLRRTWTNRLMGKRLVPHLL
eukprot:5393004-Prymnesium_polylepis.2